MTETNLKAIRKMDNILTVDHVNKRFGNHTALDDVSLAVPRGTVYGLLGPNGAGKTTLIRIINHITAPDSGEVIFDGHPLTQDDVVHIGYLPEERGLYKKMKVGDQAIFFARLKGLSKAEATRQLKEWFERFEISSWWNRKVEELSKGMAQKVQFIVTVLHRPKLLIFDEPFSGFDPINANLLRDEIIRLKNEGATVIFSTHNMASVEEICDNITLINQGQNILSGNVDEIRSQFTRGKYRLTFAGDPQAADSTAVRSSGLAAKATVRRQAAVSAAAPLCKLTQLSQLPKGEACLDVTLTEEISARQLIDAVNRTVDLTSFNPAMASMNDIFISTIKASEGNEKSL